MTASFKRLGDPLPHLDFGGSGPLAHFAHANGYPPGSYRRFLELLSADCRVLALEQLPMRAQGDPPGPIPNWRALAEDLISFLEARSDGPVIGMGHSMGGAATLFAAAARPELFEAVVLIDPVFLRTWQVLLSKVVPGNRSKNHPMIARTLGRPDRWATRQEIFDFHRDKRAFREFPDEVLWDYVNYGTVETAEGEFVLGFPKRWEAHMYATPPYVWRALKKLQVPCLGIHAERSELIAGPVLEKWRRLQPGHRLVCMPGAGHLVPFEQPAQTADAVREGLAALRARKSA